MFGKEGLKIFVTLLVALGLVAGGIAYQEPVKEEEQVVTGEIPAIDRETPNETATATFVASCFWGGDARLGVLEGVVRTRVGYPVARSDGPNSDLEKKELVQVDYDPSMITYEELIDGLGDDPNPTLLNPIATFSMASSYHQKYYLQQNKTLLNAYQEVYPNYNDLINSTAVARVNGYLIGRGNITMESLDGLGLGEKGKKIVYRNWAGVNNVSCPF